MRFPLGLSSTLATYIIRQKMNHRAYIPLVLMLEPLFACNLKCSTCGRIREYADKATDMMSISECLEAVRECGAPVVSVCGGEPLIYPKFDELVNRLIRMRKYVYLCTNGYFLASAVEKLKPSPRLQLNVHIDGPAEVHDRIVEKDGVWEAAIRGIFTASHKGFQITVNTTICRDTDINAIDILMSRLAAMGVNCFMLSPAYCYETVEDKSVFMSRDDIHAKFREIDKLAEHHCLADTPIYLEFLKGDRELQCTAWGNPTRNPAGWRSPCYLIADKHFGSYRELVESTDWSSYGSGRDPRCKDCMAHCGYEPTAALMINRRKGDLWKMLRWQFS